MAEFTLVASEDQPAACEQCEEEECICEWLPTNWRGAHGSYRTYALQQRDRRKQAELTDNDLGQAT
jgi:hypothetical protein